MSAKPKRTTGKKPKALAKVTQPVSPIQAGAVPLLTELRELILAARQQVAQAVNAGLTILYWQIGTRIRKDILKEKRAEYGEEIVHALSGQLTVEFGRGFDEKSLRHMVRFAEVFPDEAIVSALRRQLTWTHFKRLIYLDDPLKRDFYDEQREFFREVEDPDGDFVGGRQEIANSSDFRTPANLVIADAKPERTFVRMLCERDNAKVVDVWLKNTPVGFYVIEYAWKKGEHPKRGKFSPDFFLKQGDCIFVVEIKGEEETRKTGGRTGCAGCRKVRNVRL